MKCSIVMATRNKAGLLSRTLGSIQRQDVPFEYEVLVADDGSTDNTRQVCEQAGVKYIRLENDKYRNPSAARNAGYREACGKIIIAQSDEVLHESPNAIETLCTELQVGEFLIATVYDYCVTTKRRVTLYTGRHKPLPYFFLGSLWRRDLYAIGGNDEDFVIPGYDDNWFAACLIKGRGLSPRFLDDVIGYHQQHTRPANLIRVVAPSRRLYNKKVATGVFEAAGGSWDTKCNQGE